jgi:hypothetical protein
MLAAMISPGPKYDRIPKKLEGGASVSGAGLCTGVVFSSIIATFLRRQGGGN